MTLPIILLLVSIFLFLWQQKLKYPYGTFIFLISVVLFLISAYFSFLQSKVITIFIYGVILLIFWMIYKGNQKNTIKAIRSVFKNFKKENSGESNQNIALILIKDRYRLLKTKKFTEEQLINYLNSIKFDWENNDQVTYVLGSLIWALENKQYSEDFKDRIEFTCELNTKGIKTKSFEK